MSARPYGGAMVPQTIRWPPSKEDSDPSCEGGSAMATAQQGSSLGSVPEGSATRWAVRLALVGIIGPVFYVVAIAAMHFLRPNDIVLYGNTISAYSVGAYGSISMAAFVALGLGGLALSAGLRRAVMPRSEERR